MSGSSNPTSTPHIGLEHYSLCVVLHRPKPVPECAYCLFHNLFAKGNVDEPIHTSPWQMSTCPLVYCTVDVHGAVLVPDMAFVYEIWLVCMWGL